MHSTVPYMSHSNTYPAFLSYARNHHYHFDDSLRINPTSTNRHSYGNYNTGLDLSSDPDNIKQFQSDDEDHENQTLSPTSLDGTTSNSTAVPMKRRCRLVPTEQKDAIYYQKRERNNDSAKRSRDSRRIKEQEIQDRVMFLEQENLRLSVENQTIRFKLSQLHVLYNGISKPLE